MKAQRLARHRRIRLTTRIGQYFKPQTVYNHHIYLVFVLKYKNSSVSSYFYFILSFNPARAAKGFEVSSVSAAIPGGP